MVNKLGIKTTVMALPLLHLFFNVYGDTTVPNFNVASGLRPAFDVTRHPNWNLLENDSCGNSNTDRIIGGKNATLGQYPWLVRIGYSTSKSDDILYRCGGTLINKLYIVTAAHCVTNLPSDLQVSSVRLGEYNSDTEVDCDGYVCADPVQDIVPSKLLVHKDYGIPQYRNDIALIRLERPAKLTDWVSTICLSYGSLLNKEYVGQTAEVAGWGIYDNSNPRASIVLQTIRLPILPTDKCVVEFRKHASVSNRQMCVGGTRGEDSCGGDSGGPLMKVDVLDGPPRYFLIGIVSFGARRCGTNGMPAIYTRVSSYLDWILDNIAP